MSTLTEDDVQVYSRASADQDRPDAAAATLAADFARGTALARGLWALAAGLMLMYVVLFVCCAAGRLVRPLEEFTYGESWLLDGARQFARGGGLYTPADRLPLMQFAYTPLYYALVGSLQKLFGDHGYTVGRLVSLAATLVGATALGWTLRRATRSWRVGLLAAGLFLTQNLTVVLWAPLARVDSLALGLTLVGLALASAGRSSLSAVCFLLAIFSKQTFVVAPAVVALSLWPNRRALLRFAAILIGVGGLGVGVAQWLSHGWFLWHTVVSNGNEPDLDTFAALVGNFAQLNGLPVAFALALCALPSLPGQRIWRWYLAGCLLTLPSLAKLGASSNYWLELTAAVAALVAFEAYRLRAWPAARLIAPAVVVGALASALPGYQATAAEAGATLADVLQPPSPRYLSLVGDAGPDPMRVETQFVEQIAQEPGDLLTDNSGLAAAAGKPIEYEFQIFQLLQKEQHWSQQPILDAIAARRFSLVALMHPLDGPIENTRWTTAIQAALVADYAPVGAESGFWLYRPAAD